MLISPELIPTTSLELTIVKTDWKQLSRPTKELSVSQMKAAFFPSAVTPDSDIRDRENISVYWDHTIRGSCDTQWTHHNADGVFTVQVWKTTRSPSHRTRGAVVLALFGHRWKDGPVYPLFLLILLFFSLILGHKEIDETVWPPHGAAGKQKHKRGRCLTSPPGLVAGGSSVSSLPWFPSLLISGAGLCRHPAVNTS